MCHPAFLLLQKIDLALFQGHRSTHLRLNVKPRKENLWKQYLKNQHEKKHLISQKVLYNSRSHKLQLLGKPSKNKKSKSWDIVPTGGGGSSQMGGMSQPAYLVGAKVSPNQLIWSLEHIRCPKFGRGAGGQKRLGQCPNFQTFCFLMASLTDVRHFWQGFDQVPIFCPLFIQNVPLFSLPPPLKSWFILRRQILSKRRGRRQF